MSTFTCSNARCLLVYTTLLPFAGRVAHVSEMLALADEMRRSLDKEGELWVMVFKANNCISPPISRAQVCAMAYPCELNTGVAGDLLKYGWKTRQIVDECSHSLCTPPPNCSLHNRLARWSRDYARDGTTGTAAAQR